jgi:hypothetical protein
MTKPLSPAAQAILDSFKEQVELTWLTKDPDRVGLAAALRAAADQIDYDWSAFNCIDSLYEIATELEGQ